MQLISKDILVTGKHADIINKMNDIGLYKDKISVWVEGVLIGLYYGKKSVPDASNDSIVNMSGRTYFQTRSKLENMLLVFLQHEEKYQDHPLSTSDIFLIDSDSHDINQMINKLEQYALYGLEKLEKEYESILDETNNDIVIGDLMSREYISSDSINFIVKEENEYFYQTKLDPSIAAIFEESRDKYGEQ